MEYYELVKPVKPLMANATDTSSKNLRNRLPKNVRNSRLFPQAPYGLDPPPSNYHLFRSRQIDLTEIWFISEQGTKNWLDLLLALLLSVIHNLPEGWENLIASDGQFFE